jgi:putative transposase
MMIFKNKKSIRLKGCDYGAPGLFYITICSKDRNEVFGEIVNDRMVLSTIGEIVNAEWEATERLRQNVKLHEFVIMPNHLHGIIEILDLKRRIDVNQSVQTKDIDCEVGVDCHQPTFQNNGNFNQYGPQRNNLFSIIRGFKANVTKRVRNEIDPYIHIWQTRFYDHLVRDQADLERIRYYINTNVENWQHDRNNI